jgi:hypothetical protein
VAINGILLQEDAVATIIDDDGPATLALAEGG